MTDHMTANLDQIISEMNAQQIEVLYAFVACSPCDRNTACLTRYRYTRQLPHPTPEALSAVRRCQAAKARPDATISHQQPAKEN